MKSEETIANHCSKNCEFCQLKSNFAEESFCNFCFLEPAVCAEVGFLSILRLLKGFPANIFQSFWTQFKGSGIQFREWRLIFPFFRHFARPFCIIIRSIKIGSNYDKIQIIRIFTYSFLSPTQFRLYLNWTKLRADLNSRSSKILGFLWIQVRCLRYIIYSSSSSFFPRDFRTNYWSF